MAKEQQNHAQKYLEQKRNTTRDIIFGALFGVGLIMFMLIRGGGYYGMIAMLFSAIGLIWSKSLKIKDEEFEEILRFAIRDNDVALLEERLELYDVGKGKIAIGKDDKPRSAYWVSTNFDFKGDCCEITKYEIDIVNESVVKETYSAKLPCHVSVEEKEIAVPVGKKRISYVTIDEGKLVFPVDPISIDTESILMRLK